MNIESSSNICSIALSRNGKLISLKESDIEKSHAEKLTVFIEEILEENNIPVNTIDAIAVSKGPGSYTGLRIGVSVAKGMCYALKKPLIAIDTMQLLSQEIINEPQKYSL
ncbi:tRNA (adenosine(37)-N6)-threonylcarbamoyltransferase complex dimerization subunit type 1 TsaB, partial [Bacteroidota bacterium]